MARSKPRDEAPRGVWGRLGRVGGRLIERQSNLLFLAGFALAGFALFFFTGQRASQISNLAICTTTGCSVRADLDEMCAIAAANQKLDPRLALTVFAQTASRRVKSPAGLQLLAEIVAADPNDRGRRLEALAATADPPGVHCPALTELLSRGL